MEIDSHAEVHNIHFSKATAKEEEDLTATNTTPGLKYSKSGIELIPQPSDDPEDPLV